MQDGINLMSDGVLPQHLGGHLNRTHTDRGTLKYLIQQYQIKSMVDIGCGTGQMVEIAQDRGLDVMGIDGDWFVMKAPHINVMIHDFRDPIEISRTWDLAWAVEFLEHVEEKYMDNYMTVFNACRYAIVTHALPGHPGHYHVNCQDPEYWIEKFDKYNFDCDLTESVKIRQHHATMLKPFMQKTGLFFKNREFHDAT